MMKRANPGVTDPKKWKAPQGYESAISKARKAARAKDDKKSGSVNSIQPGTDTASEDEDDSDTFSQAGNFRMCALRPVSRGTPLVKATISKRTTRSICSVNRFEGLDVQQEFCPETLAALGSGGEHEFRRRPRSLRRQGGN